MTKDVFLGPTEPWPHSICVTRDAMPGYRIYRLGRTCHNEWSYAFKCSRCGGRSAMGNITIENGEEVLPSYCPNCGACIEYGGEV